MEFFQELPFNNLDIDKLKQSLTIEALPSLCASIDKVLSAQGNEGEIYCLWGQFNIKREELRYGIRYALLNCPHALSWTVTSDNASQHIIIHCTIDKQYTDLDFVDSIHVFVEDWLSGINELLSTSNAPT